MTGLLSDLLAHQAWADAMFFHAWGKSGFREDPELRERTGHQVEVQEAFLGILRGAPLSAGDRPLPAFEDLEARCRICHEGFLGLAQTLDDASRARIIRVPWFPDPPCLVPVEQALVQACLHSQHHRGQNMARLKALGGVPRNVDYLIWLWKQRPAPRWER